MQNDSKLIAAAYFKKLNEGMQVVPAPVAPSDRAHDEDEEINLKNKLKSVIHQSSLSDQEKQACMRMMGMDEDEEHNYENDRTDQDANDKSAIDYAREERAAAARDKWTQGQGVGGKYQF
jgi:hypothetical protein